jgi:predicted RecA/RadA family phage recombinase
MSKNFVQNGDRISFPAASVVTANNYANPQSGGIAGDGPLSGEAGVIGRVVGVVVDNSINGTAGPLNDSNVVLELRGVFSLNVQSIHHAIAVGSTAYINATTGVVSDDYTQVPFGCVLDAVSQYATTNVRVKLFGLTPGAIGADS